MADRSNRPLLTGESDEEARELVRKDLHSSDNFKREYWPADLIANRRKAVDGDPDAYDFPYDNSWGHRPVNNWMRVQITHKVGKLSRSPTRLNLQDANGADDPGTRLKLIALRHRLEHKAREAGWSYGRRRMMFDAATTAYGIRAVGLQYERDRYVLKNFAVRAEEFHMDPLAESMDDAEWVAWRRMVSATKLPNTLARHPGISPMGAGPSLAPDSRPSEIALSDDRILLQGRGPSDKGSPFGYVESYLVTDYYRRDQTQDWYYPCPQCDQYVGRSTIEEAGVRYPLYKCPMCDHELKTPPPRETMRRRARYPNGRHVRLIQSDVDYRGENMLRLEDVFPFVGMSWYDSRTWVGKSEVEQLMSAAVLNSIAMAMVSDNAFANAHPKVQTIAKGIVSGWNNRPETPIEISQELHAAGGLKRLEVGDVAPAVRILLERSMQDLWLLAMNSPESQGQEPDTIRSGVGLSRIIAASEVGLYLANSELIRADARFFRLVRDLCAMVDTPTQVPMVTPGGIPGTFDYDRSLMSPNVQVEVVTERDVDQEREELFSRAVEMRQMQVRAVDDDMLLDLSGIPADIIQRGKERAAMQAAQLGGAGLSPSITTGAPAGPPTNGETNGAGEIPNRIMGRMAPRQTRPPSRSRGAKTPEAAFGGS